MKGEAEKSSLSGACGVRGSEDCWGLGSIGAPGVERVRPCRGKSMGRRGNRRVERRLHLETPELETGDGKSPNSTLTPGQDTLEHINILGRPSSQRPGDSGIHWAVTKFTPSPPSAGRPAACQCWGTSPPRTAACPWPPCAGAAGSAPPGSRRHTRTRTRAAPVPPGTAAVGLSGSFTGPLS